VKIIWKKINKHKPFRYISEKSYTHDVQKSIPDIEKAKSLLGFEPTKNLSEILDEIIPWVRAQLENNET